MFLPSTRSLAVRDDAFRSLRLSLNTPELCADELPAGPARAGIALYVESDGTYALTVAVRSLGGGRLVAWSWDQPLSPSSFRSGIDAALCFAEGMGFLFDEDAIGSSSGELRRRALDGWWELAGWPEVTTIDLVTPPTEVETQAPRPDPASRVDLVPCVDSEAQGASQLAMQTPPERLPLTKFRRRLGGPPLETAPEPSPTQGSALGRLRLVKRARQGEGAPRPPLWMRLLGSF